jgi:hypothetical protein
MAEVVGNPNPKSIVRLGTTRRITVIAVVVTAQLGSAGLAIGVAPAAGPGLTTVVAVSIDGTTGRWTPIEPTAEAPAAPVAATAPATAPPAPTPDPSVVPTTPVAPETITPTAASTPPVDEPSSPNEPEPTARS